jgi:hypothetical protein
MVGTYGMTKMLIYLIPCLPNNESMIVNLKYLHHLSEHISISLSVYPELKSREYPKFIYDISDYINLKHSTLLSSGWGLDTLWSGLN